MKQKEIKWLVFLLLFVALLSSLFTYLLASRNDYELILLRNTGWATFNGILIETQYPEIFTANDTNRYNKVYAVNLFSGQVYVFGISYLTEKGEPIYSGSLSIGIGKNVTCYGILYRIVNSKNYAYWMLELVRIEEFE